MQQQQLKPSPKYKTKKRISLTLDYKLNNQFNMVSEKYLQPKSKLVESWIKRYVEAKL